MPTKAMTHADYERLRADHERLATEVNTLREVTTQLRSELKTQFTRIAEMQAILDEERIANTRK